MESFLQYCKHVEEIITSHDSNSTGFFMETDYMDDLKRPGAVLGPKPYKEGKAVV